MDVFGDPYFRKPEKLVRFYPIPLAQLGQVDVFQRSAGGCTADGDYCDYFLRPTAHCTSPARDDGKTTLQFADGTHVLDPRKKV